MKEIKKSIALYQDSIMKDINAMARIVVTGKEDKTYVTTIIDWHNTEISFHAPLVLGDYVRLLHNHVYPFVIVTKACIYMTSVKIKEYSKDKKDNFFYRATIASPLERNQQRQHFRLDWVVPFKYTTIDPNKWENANLLDISAGGMKIACEKRLSRNDSIHIEITLLNTTLLLDGVVLDELEKNAANLYVYRVQFHELSRTTENLLAQLIMRRQRNMLQRN